MTRDSGGEVERVRDLHRQVDEAGEPRGITIEPRVERPQDAPGRTLPGHPAQRDEQILAGERAREPAGVRHSSNCFSRSSIVVVSTTRPPT